MTEKQRRGFASMDRDKQRAIAQKGGQAAHRQGVAHRWTPAEAAEAGRKGGLASNGGRGKGSREMAQIAAKAHDRAVDALLKGLPEVEP